MLALLLMLPNATNASNTSNDSITTKLVMLQKFR